MSGDLFPVQAVTARLIVRRVRDLNRRAAEGQDELFACWRYHAVFTDSPFRTIQAESQHRDHALVEQVFADLTSGPLAHLPSGSFAANAAWLTCTAMSHNLTRAAGALAGLFHARARATIRSHLIAVAARIARHGHGHITLHLPDGWHRDQEWLNLFEAACGRRPGRPDQPGTGHRPQHGPSGHPPARRLRNKDKPQNSQRQDCDARTAPRSPPAKSSPGRRSPEFTRWIEA